MKPLDRSKLGASAAALALVLMQALPTNACASPTPAAPRVQLHQGEIEGLRAQAGSAQLRVFLGVPYAAPPVGAYRWQAPQPVARWASVRDTARFAPRCMQLPRYRSTFRSTGMSEDCLYLNVWTPAASEREKRPVLVYFHGGGFDAGDGSEPRYDGAQLASRGIVTVTVNYRLGVFGFLGPSRCRQRIGQRHGRQLRSARSIGGAAMGAGQHRTLRRRSGSSHDWRRRGGRHFGQRTHGIPAFARAFCARIRRERRRILANQTLVPCRR